MKRVFIPLVLMSFALVASAQESLTLRYNPQEGKTYRYSSELKFTSTTMGTSDTTKVLMVQAIEITKRTDTQIDSLVKPEFVRIAANRPGSEKALEQAAAEAKKGVLTCQSDVFGTTIKSTSSEASGMSNQMAQMNGLFGTGVFGPIFPKDPVAIGKGWTHDLDIKSLMGPAAAMLKDQKPITFTFTLKSIGESNGRKTAKIEWTVVGNLTMSAPTGGESAKMAFSGEGVSDIDVLTGLNLKSSGNLTIKIEAAGGPNGQTMNMSQGFTIKSELLEPKKI
jgi:hypothetical protein